MERDLFSTPGGLGDVPADNPLAGYVGRYVRFVGPIDARDGYGALDVFRIDLIQKTYSGALALRGVGVITDRSSFGRPIDPKRIRVIAPDLVGAEIALAREAIATKEEALARAALAAGDEDLARGFRAAAERTRAGR